MVCKCGKIILIVINNNLGTVFSVMVRMKERVGDETQNVLERRRSQLYSLPAEKQSVNINHIVLMLVV